MEYFVKQPKFLEITVEPLPQGPYGDTIVWHSHRRVATGKDVDHWQTVSASSVSEFTIIRTTSMVVVFNPEKDLGLTVRSALELSQILRLTQSSNQMEKFNLIEDWRE